MIIDYSNFSYRPDYGYELYKDNELVQRSDKVKYAACFAEVFNYFNGRKDLIYKGKYILRCRKKFVKGSGNYCPLNKVQIFKILRYMRKKLGINIYFEDSKDNYIFTLEVEGKPVKHKFALTFSRVFFEFPYNEMAKETLRIRDLGVVNGFNFSHINFLKLFHVISMTKRMEWGYGHSLFLYPCLDMSTKVARNAFEEGRVRVQDVYVGDDALERKIKRDTLSYKGKDWDEGLEERAPIYADNFKNLRNAKKNKNIRRRRRA